MSDDGPGVPDGDGDGGPDPGVGPPGDRWPAGRSPATPPQAGWPAAAVGGSSLPEIDYSKLKVDKHRSVGLLLPTLLLCGFLFGLALFAAWAVERAYK